MKEKMFRLQMQFKKPKQCPPGQDVTYIRAKTATDAIAVAKKVHKNDFGGFVDAKARIVS